MDVKKIHADWLANGLYPLDKEVKALPYSDAVAKALQKVSDSLGNQYRSSPEDFVKVAVYLLVRSVSTQELEFPLVDLLRRVEEAYGHGEILKRELERNTSVHDGLSALFEKIARKNSDKWQKQAKESH